MKNASPTQPMGDAAVRLSRLRLFLALSRTLHGSLDMAAPLMAALLWLGGLPEPRVALLGAGTLFAGYTAVYALNDLIGRRLDRDKLQQQQQNSSDGTYLDSALMRRPLAQEALSRKEALIWTVAWFLLAIAGAWILNPICVAIFLGAGSLEALYCLLVRVSPLRALVNGAVKTAGPMAAVLAVDPHPSLFFLALLFCSIFLWEVGGQNIPADWSDLETDRSLGAKTIPVALGIRPAAAISLVSLLLASILTLILFTVSPLSFSWWHLLPLAGAAVYCLLVPGVRLVLGLSSKDSVLLFNRASFWPLCLLLVALLGIFTRI